MLPQGMAAAVREDQAGFLIGQKDADVINEFGRVVRHFDAVGEKVLYPLQRFRCGNDGLAVLEGLDQFDLQA